VDSLARISLDIAKDIQADIPQHLKPPAEGFQAETDQVIPLSYVRNTRGYIIKAVNQVNGCYEKGWSDACAVMIRRLCEILIIEVYEAKGMISKIQDLNGNYFSLDALIKCVVSEPTWNLNRFSKQTLPKVADAGNLSAHGNRYVAHIADLVLLIPGLRATVQDLIKLSGIQK
jgi:hypothetical protein